MEALKRTPELKITNEFTLSDGTVIGIKERKAIEFINQISKRGGDDFMTGLRNIADKIVVKLPKEEEFKHIVYDDLVNCFTDDELMLIMNNVNEAMGVQKNV